MIDAQLNVFDIIVIAVIALSTLLSFFRGFVREVLALAGWVGATIITIYFFPDVTALIRPYFGSDAVASGAAALGTFIAALVAISLLNALILKYVKAGNDVGILDNMLGLIFGAARGAFMVSLGYLLLSLIFAKEHYPDWLENAQTRPYAEQGAGLLAQVAPKYLSEDSKLGGELSKIGEKAADAREKQGYGEDQLKSMDRLIDATAPKD